MQSNPPAMLANVISFSHNMCRTTINYFSNLGRHQLKWVLSLQVVETEDIYVILRQRFICNLNNKLDHSTLDAFQKLG